MPGTTERLSDQRSLFGTPRDIAYLNCAYMSPMPRPAIDAGREGLASKAEPWAIPPEAFFSQTEVARERFGRLVGASAGDIAIIPSVSYGVATAALALAISEGQNIVIPAEEFPSGVYAWRRLAETHRATIRTVERPDHGDWTAQMVEAIDGDTALVCTSATHWVCGSTLDPAILSERCKRTGAALVLDLTQSCGADPVDVRTIDPDFLVAASYKWLLGPYSLGFLYVAPRHQGIEPFEAGWAVRDGAEDFRNLADYTDRYQPGARRFDVGERSNFALLPAAIAAMDLLLEWTPERIAATLGDMNAAIAERAEPLGLQALPPKYRSPHYLSLRLDRSFPDDLVRQLAARSVYVSMRGSWLRVTPHLYNDGEDIARFLEALTDILG